MSTTVLLKPENIYVAVHQMLSPRQAAELITRHLGKSDYWWSELLREDLRRAESEHTLPRYASFDGDEVFYDLTSIHRFIVDHAPGSILLATPHKCIDRILRPLCMDDCDVEKCKNSCATGVQVIWSSECDWLSARDARRIGERLIELASWCDSHRYDLSFLASECAETTSAIASETVAA